MNDRIFAVFDKLIAERDSFDWNTVLREVRAAQIPVKNWLKVRAVLQWFINEGIIQRTDSVTEERYIRKSA